MLKGDESFKLLRNTFLSGISGLEMKVDIILPITKASFVSNRWIMTIYVS